MPSSPSKVARIARRPVPPGGFFTGMLAGMYGDAEVVIITLDIAVLPLGGVTVAGVKIQLESAGSPELERSTVELNPKLGSHFGVCPSVHPVSRSKRGGNKSRLGQVLMDVQTTGTKRFSSEGQFRREQTAGLP